MSTCREEAVFCAATPFCMHFQRMRTHWIW